MNDEQNEGFKRFTLSQAAKELGVSIPSARRLIFSGKLQGFKVKKGEKERWELLQSEVFKLKHSGAEVIEAIGSGKPDENWTAQPSKPSESFGERFEAFEGVPLAAHLAALDLARAQMEHLQRQVEESQRLAQRQAEESLRAIMQAERAKYSLEAQLAQYQRVLAESAESLAEERAMRLAAEAKAAEVEARPVEVSQVSPPVPMPEPVTDTPTKRRGWGSRLKVWLLGEKVV